MNNKYFNLKVLDFEFTVETNNNKVVGLDIYYKTPNLEYETNNDLINHIKDELTNYLTNKSNYLNFEYELNGTNFQKNVWNILLKIPYGKVVSYEDIALKLGNKNKVRAVGNAVGKNPILIKVPCHRVIRKNNELGGFSSGIDTKIFLHKVEGIKL